MIVDYGNGAQSWVWVPFEGDSITMTEMLRLSDLDLIMVDSGTWGNAVCKIETTGCDPAACRRLCQTKSSDPFWRLMWLDGETWRMTSTGVDATRVGDGEVVALSWSAQTPELPIVSVNDVASKVNANTTDQADSTVTRTFGDLPGQDQRNDSWIPIVGSVGVVLLTAGVLIFRGRRKTRLIA